MHRRTAATVRLTLWSVVAASLAMALVQPADAQAPIGVLYFTNTALADNGDPTGGCPSLPVYAMEPVVPGIT